MKIRIDSIVINANRRVTDPVKVQAVADSIKEVGLLSPIVVSQDNTLVAGLHRVEAFKLLGRDEIPVTLAEVNDSLRLRLAELDENLVRNEGTQLEQSEWLAELMGQPVGSFDNPVSTFLQAYSSIGSR